jgi:hypothetical protein
VRSQGARGVALTSRGGAATIGIAFRVLVFWEVFELRVGHKVRVLLKAVFDDPGVFRSGALGRRHVVEMIKV